MSNELSVLVNDQRNNFMAVAVDRSVNFDREAQFAIQILSGSEYLSKTALGNKASLVAAVNNVSAIGITLNPAQKLAYLVPRKGAICLDVSYMGLMHLAQVSGAIQWGQAAIVRTNDHFELRGVDKEPVHTYQPFGDRGEIVGVYVVVKTDGGDYLTEAMSKNQIDDIKVRSEAWKAYEAKGTKCPWVTDYEEMAKKTVVKRAAKYWPRRERLDRAVHYLNTDADEGINFERERALPGHTQLADLEQFGEPAKTAERDALGKVPSSGTALGACSDAFAVLDTEEQEFLRQIADEMKGLIALPDVAGAVQHRADQNLTNEEKLALWSLFDSKERSAINKEVRRMEESKNVQ